MDGHHPHLVALLLHVAFDLRLASLQPGQEALQRRRVRALEGQRQRQKLVNGVVYFGAQPGVQGLPAACALFAHIQDAGEELIGRGIIRPRQDVGQKPVGFRQPGRIGLAGFQTLPQAVIAPVIGQGEKFVFVQTGQRSFQDTGEIQIVRGQEGEAGQRHQVHHRKLIG